jgi:hypothetical protein
MLFKSGYTCNGSLYCRLTQMLFKSIVRYNYLNS